MNDSVILGAIKRRWWLIAIFAVVGALLGALPEPAQVEEQERSFSATHTLLVNDTSGQQSFSAISPNQVTLFATTGEVPQRAAVTLDYSGNPASLADRVDPDYDFSNGALTKTGTGALTLQNVTNRFTELQLELASVIPGMSTFILDDFLPVRYDIVLDAFYDEGLYTP